MARIPKEHLWVGEVGPDPANNPVDNRHPMEQNAYDPNGNPPVGLSRGIRYLYDPALSAPYPGYAPGQGTLYNATGWAHYDGGSFRQDNFGRTLPALPRLPVSTGYVFYGEIR
jgi:hypothetical protein